MRVTLPAAMALVTLLTATAALADSMDRARDAQKRGDLRAAQIEFRNAVRDDPRSAAARAALAAASLDLGDGITAEKEARTALDLGFDPAAATSLTLRAYLVQGHFQQLLRDFPLLPSAPPAVAGQVAAGRALAQLATNQTDAATASVADAIRLAPAAVEPYLAKSAVALAAGDRPAAEAAVDEALSKAGNNPDALLRKGSFQLERRDFQGASATLTKLIDIAPGNVAARLTRAEASMQLGDDAGAKRDIDAALTTLPNVAAGHYLRARLLAKAQNWQAVDAELESINPLLGNFPEGYLLQAAAKGALGQTAQAEDAARRYVARQPDDPRGAKLLASLQAKAGRPGDAITTLTKLADRGKADAESYDLLASAYSAVGKPADAAMALERASALAPKNSTILARLAAARLAIGDLNGARTAAEASLQLQPTQPGVQELLATVAFARGDVDAAAAELAKSEQAKPDQSKPEQQGPSQAKRSEAANLLQGNIDLDRLDFAGARAAFEQMLRDNPTSVAAHLGLAQVAAAQGNDAENISQLSEVLKRNPTNAAALGKVAAIAMAGGPNAGAARKALEAAHAGAPQETAPALVLADVLVRTGAAADAVRVLNEPQYQSGGRGALLPYARSLAYAAAGQWTDAQAAASAAVAEAPDSVPARLQLASVTAHGGDLRAAEAVIAEGLRRTPGNMGLQQAALRLARDARGVDGALARADQLAQAAQAPGGSGELRGEVLASDKRYDEAARSFAAAYEKAPSSGLATQWAAVLQLAGKPDDAAGVLRAWLDRDPSDAAALTVLSGLDIQAGRYDQAERRLDALVGKLPNDAAALNNLAWLLNRRNAGDARALGLAERAYYLLPNPDTTDTLGWVLARQGKLQDALPLLRRAADQGAAKTPSIGYHLAWALRAAGNREEASRVLAPVLAGPAFAERADAQQLASDLRSGG